MGVVVNLGKELVKKAKRSAIVEHRSVAKQIEYWAKIGCIAEQNPDLSYNDIKGILIGLEDILSNNIEDYDSKKV